VSQAAVLAKTHSQLKARPKAFLAFVFFRFLRRLPFGLFDTGVTTVYAA